MEAVKTFISQHSSITICVLLALAPIISKGTPMFNPLPERNEGYQLNSRALRDALVGSIAVSFVQLTETLLDFLLSRQKSSHSYRLIRALTSIGTNLVILLQIVPTSSPESLFCILNAEIIIYIHTFLKNLGDLGSNVWRQQSLSLIAWSLSMPFMFNSYSAITFFRIDVAVTGTFFVLGILHFLWKSFLWCIFVLDSYVSGFQRMSDKDLNCTSYVLWGILFTLVTLCIKHTFFSHVQWEQEQDVSGYCIFRIYASVIFITSFSLLSDHMLRRELFSVQASPTNNNLKILTIL